MRIAKLRQKRQTTYSFEYRPRHAGRVVRLLCLVVGAVKHAFHKGVMMMREKKKTLSNALKGISAAVIIVAGVSFIAARPSAVENSSARKASTVKTIENVDQFTEIIESSGDQLLLFDLYADWCMPCKVLSPQLEKIAEANAEKATVYKINVDKHPALAQAFGVQGIPYVVFVKNKAAVHAITGVQPRGAYEKAIADFAG
jgi:thioredoxin 1